MRVFTRIDGITARFAAAAALLIAGAIVQAQAQEMPPPPPPPDRGFPPPPDGGGDFEGPGGPPPQRQQRGQMPLTAATIPASALVAYLSLSAEQGEKLQQTVEALRAARPRPGGGGARLTSPGAAAGPPAAMPAREEREAARLVFEAAIKRANRQIDAFLTDSQKRQLPILVRALKAMQADRISLNAATRMHLTKSQIDKLAALSSGGADDEVVLSLFTGEQREIVNLNRTRVQRPGGGSGPPQGPDFGPPEDGGPGGW